MRSFKVTEQNNFCRIFELPDKLSDEFCFNGGIPILFKMVDWFNPVSDCPCEITTDSLCGQLEEWLQDKSYVRPGKKYLLISDFGASFIFSSRNEVQA